MDYDEFATDLEQHLRKQHPFEADDPDYVEACIATYVAYMVADRRLFLMTRAIDTGLEVYRYLSEVRDRARRAHFNIRNGLTPPMETTSIEALDEAAM